MISPYGNEFRSLMNVWDRQQLLEAIQEKKNRIKALIEGGPLLLFMKHKGSGDIFGSDENSRVIFARMKNPDAEQPEEWADEANFSAFNMCKLLNGEKGHEALFGKKDLDKLDVIDDKENLIDMLVKAIKGSGGSGAVTIRMRTPGDIEFGNPLQEK